MLVLDFNFTVVDLRLHVHKFVESFHDISKGGAALGIIEGVDVIDVKGGFFNGLNIEKVIANSTKDVVDLLNVLVLSCNDDLLIQVIDSDNVTDHRLKCCLEPVNPSTVILFLDLIVVIDINTSHVAIEVCLGELDTSQLGVISQEIVSIL